MIFNAIAETGFNSDLWVSAICDSTYFESVLCDQVPTMTSDTEPSGEASASSVYNNDNTNYGTWKAFCGYVGGWNSISNTTAGWVQYKFDSPINIKKATWSNSTGSDAGKSPRNIQIMGSNDGNSFDQLASYVNTSTERGASFELTIKNTKKYLIYRFNVTSINSSYNPMVIVPFLQFYGRY